MNCCDGCDNLLIGCTCTRRLQLSVVAIAVPTPAALPAPSPAAPKAFAGKASMAQGCDCHFCYRTVDLFYMSMGTRGTFAICLKCSDSATQAMLTTLDRPGVPRGVS